MIENLKHHDPDLLFFAGDQTYHHTQHTFGWLEFGIQFRDILRDRPSITILDDHFSLGSFFNSCRFVRWAILCAA